MDATRLDRLKERFLLAAAKAGRLEEVVSLLELGADSDNCLTFGERDGQHEDGEEADDEEEVEGDGDTPLIAATRAGHVEIVSVLLAYGADPNSKNQRGDSYALHAAAENGHVDVYCLLIAHGAFEHWENAEGMTARQVAQRNGHLRRILRGLRKAEGKDDWSQTDGSCSQCTAELDEHEAENVDENGGEVDEDGSLYTHILSVASHDDDDDDDGEEEGEEEGLRSSNDEKGDSNSTSCNEASSCSTSGEASDDSSGASAASDQAISGAPTDIVVVDMSHDAASRTEMPRTGQIDAREVAADLYLADGEGGGVSDGRPAVSDDLQVERDNGVRTLRQRLALLRSRRDTSTTEESQESTSASRDDGNLAASDNAYMQAPSTVEALQNANAALEEDKRLLIEKLMRLKRYMDAAIHQKEMALEYGRVAKAKYRRARKEREDALARVQAAESNQFESFFGIGTDFVVSPTSLSLEELDSMEMKLRGALDAVAEAKEAHLRRRLEQQNCVICMDSPKTVLLLPCSHLCVCSNCSERAELVNCPLCRNVIESTIKTFA